MQEYSSSKTTDGRALQDTKKLWNLVGKEMERALSLLFIAFLYYIL